MLAVTRSRCCWMLTLIIAAVRMGETQGTEREAQVNSIKSLEPQISATNRSSASHSGIPKKSNIPAQVNLLLEKAKPHQALLLNA